MAQLDQEKARLLRYVRVPPDGIDLGGFPDFLILGPQRTGTTWLQKNLERHPEVFMATPKELFFFNLLDLPSFPLYRSSDLEWYLSHFRESESEVARKQERALAQCGLPYTPRVRGEATAGYAAMGPHLIREVTILNPRIKAILTIRDPVERAWSHAKLDLTTDKGGSISEVSDSRFEAFFKTGYQKRCARYQEQISNWRQFLEPDALLVCLFDDLRDKSEEFLQRIFRFLGVREDVKLNQGSVRRRENETEDIEVPPRFREMLSQILRAEIEQWRDLVGRYRGEEAGR